MSSEEVDTTYLVSINGPYGMAFGTFSSGEFGDQWTDEFALSIAAALNSLTWPEGSSYYVQKVVNNKTTSDPDLTADPPVFD